MACLTIRYAIYLIEQLYWLMPDTYGQQQKYVGVHQGHITVITTMLVYTRDVSWSNQLFWCTPETYHRHKIYVGVHQRRIIAITAMLVYTRDVSQT
ncbi:hypothetical protein ACJMK2_043387 [Sinanodonta woodiana]|uniref:Secreted protein n=1 Tax=Sinanodonta woodiana TaxID=1069815 RepID=A0ABD3VWQ0_SINWO